MTAPKTTNQEKLLTPGEVAERFRVDPKTVARWAKSGLLPCVRTPGGHRRYPESRIEELAQERYERPRTTG